MADKLGDDASCAKDGEAAARKPWSTPSIILSTVQGTTNKDFYHIGETHIGSSSSSGSSQQGGGAS